MSLKISVLSCCLCFLLALESYCWKDFDQKPFSVSADLGGIPVGAYGLRFQYASSQFISWTLPLDFSMKNAGLLSPLAIDIIRVFGYGAIPDFKIGSGLGVMFNYDGWYIEPSLKMGYASSQYPEFFQSFFFLSPTLTVGHQSIFDFGMVINLGLGISRIMYFPNIPATDVWMPTAIFAIGYAF